MADVIESDKEKNSFSLQGGSAIRNPARNAVRACRFIVSRITKIFWPSPNQVTPDIYCGKRRVDSGIV